MSPSTAAALLLLLVVAGWALGLGMRRERQRWLREARAYAEGKRRRYAAARRERAGKRKGRR